MLSNEQMIKLMVVEPSWEDVIIKIVAEEGMSPWSIDITKLADAFSTHIEQFQKENDLRVPARFILIAAILLRMKSDVLAEKEQKVLIPESPDQSQKEADLLRQLAGVPPLDPPIKRMPLKNVSLTELIGALRKAFNVEERRKARKERQRAIVGQVLAAEPDDISERIEKLLAQIKDIISEIENGKIEFSKLVSDWKREKIVKTLMPMLHLAQEGKIGYEQGELFQEIMVELKGDAEKNNEEGKITESKESGDSGVEGAENSAAEESEKSKPSGF